MDPRRRKEYLLNLALMSSRYILTSAMAAIVVDLGALFIAPQWRDAKKKQLEEAVEAQLRKIWKK
jgi:hypothetical protein